MYGSLQHIGLWRLTQDICGHTLKMRRSVADASTRVELVLLCSLLNTTFGSTGSLTEHSYTRID